MDSYLLWVLLTFFNVGLINLPLISLTLIVNSLILKRKMIKTILKMKRIEK